MTGSASEERATASSEDRGFAATVPHSAANRYHGQHSAFPRTARVSFMVGNLLYTPLRLQMWRGWLLMRGGRILPAPPVTSAPLAPSAAVRLAA